MLAVSAGAVGFPSTAFQRVKVDQGLSVIALETSAITVLQRF